MRENLKDLISKLSKNGELGNKFSSLKGENDIYKFFSENGYEGSQSDFKKELSELIKSCELPEEYLEYVSGGANKNVSRAVASVLALVSFMSVSTPKANAMFARFFYPTDEITKDAQQIPWNPKTFSEISNKLSALCKEKDLDGLFNKFYTSYNDAYFTLEGKDARKINIAVYYLHKIFQKIFSEDAKNYTAVKFENTRRFVGIGNYCETIGHNITPDEILEKINKATQLFSQPGKSDEKPTSEATAPSEKQINFAVVDEACKLLRSMVDTYVKDEKSKGSVNDAIENFKKSFSAFVKDSNPGEDIIDKAVYDLNAVYDIFFSKDNGNSHLRGLAGYDVGQSTYNIFGISRLKFSELGSRRRFGFGYPYYNYYFQLANGGKSIFPEDLLDNIKYLNSFDYKNTGDHFVGDGEVENFEDLIKDHVIGDKNANEEQVQSLLKNVNLACEYSYLSYDIHDRVYGEYGESYGHLHAKVFGGEEKNTHSGIVELRDDGCLVIAFHGTNSKRDGFTDANAGKQNCEFLRESEAVCHSAHAGFVNRYGLIKESMYKAINEVCQGKDVKKVIVTGHSLGGALATLAAVDINSKVKKSDVEVKGLPEAQLITFCSPRVLSERSVAFVMKNELLSLNGDNVAIRIWRNDDLVPKVAPKSMTFEHIGKPWRLDKNPPAYEGEYKDTAWEKVAYLPWHGIGGILEDINAITGIYEHEKPATEQTEEESKKKENEKKKKQEVARKSVTILGEKVLSRPSSPKE